MSPTSLPLLRTLDAGFVTSWLAVGGDLHHDEQHAADQLVELISVGVSHMVDLRREWSDEAWVRRVWPQMAYLHHGIDDAGQRIPDEWFDTGVNWIRAAADRNNIVYVHCHEGSNRSPSMALAVLLMCGHDVVEAIDMVATARPQARFAYATDALEWYHRRRQVPSRVQQTNRRRLASWYANAHIVPSERRNTAEAL